LQAYLGERYCISVPPCPDSRWGNGVPPTKYLGERRSPAFPLHYTTDLLTTLATLFCNCLLILFTVCYATFHPWAAPISLFASNFGDLSARCACMCIFCELGMCCTYHRFHELFVQGGMYGNMLLISQIFSLLGLLAL